METDPLTQAIIGAAIQVHNELGPGLLESTYETCLAYELASCGLEALRQVQLPVLYKGIHLECGYRIDLLVERTVIVEVKAVETLTALHQAQLFTYLKLSGHKIGLLINFNAKTIKQGLQRVVR